ncbi:hypothetical protein YC2023_007074 [Brassica napus]
MPTLSLIPSYLYLMKLKIGTPPVEIDAAIDTGSHIIWTQCLPCLHCYKQRNPIFDPSKSSTYKECNTTQSCDYDLVYGDLSYSKGRLATETVTIQSTSGHSYVMPETVIGCSHNSSGLVRSTASGIVGLGWESLSLISQMGKNMLGAFSYCFSHEGTSKISFGSNAIVSGDGTVSTPMFMKKEKRGYYYLNLDAVSVGEARVETLGTPFHAVDDTASSRSGQQLLYERRKFIVLKTQLVPSLIIRGRKSELRQSLIFSAFTLPVLFVAALNKQLRLCLDCDVLALTVFLNTLNILHIVDLSLVRESVEKVVTAEKLDNDDMLCYKTNSMDVFPVITMHFSGGADLVLDKNNTYMAFNGQAICLIIICGPVTPIAEKAIFGNRAQNNFLVGYDRSSLQVSFKPTDCGVTQDMPRDSTSAASKIYSAVDHS